jgi:hypothetical protein
VDNYFHVLSTKVSVEVKCPLEDKQAPFPGNITLKPVGRVPNLTGIERVKQRLESGSSGTNFPMGKNPDLRMKDCLESANEKFCSQSGVDHLNVLFLSCGQFHNISEWYLLELIPSESPIQQADLFARARAAGINEKYARQFLGILCGSVSQPAPCSFGTTNFRQVSGSFGTRRKE